MLIVCVYYMFIGRIRGTFGKQILQFLLFVIIFFDFCYNQLYLFLLICVFLCFKIFILLNQCEICNYQATYSWVSAIRCSRTISSPVYTLWTQMSTACLPSCYPTLPLWQTFFSFLSLLPSCFFLYTGFCNTKNSPNLFLKNKPPIL